MRIDSYITTGLIKALQLQSQELKRNLIIPEISGVFTNVQYRSVDEEKTISIPQGFYSFGSPNVKGAVILATGGLGPCVAVVAYNSQTKIGMIAHIDEANKTKNVMDIIYKGLGSDVKIAIIGGIVNGQSSSFATSELGSYITEDVVNSSKDIISEIIKHGTNCNIVGKSILQSRIQSVALDTSIGEIFIPQNLPSAHGRQSRGFIQCSHVNEKGVVFHYTICDKNGLDRNANVNRVQL